MPLSTLSISVAGPLPAVAVVAPAPVPTRAGGESPAASDSFARALNDASTPPPAAPQRNDAQSGPAADRGEVDDGASQAATDARGAVTRKPEARANAALARPTGHSADAELAPGLDRSAAPGAGQGLGPVDTVEASGATADTDAEAESPDTAEAATPLDTAALLAGWLARSPLQGAPGPDGATARALVATTAAAAAELSRFRAVGEPVATAAGAEPGDSSGPSKRATASAAGALPGSDKAGAARDAATGSDTPAQRAFESNAPAALAASPALLPASTPAGHGLPAALGAAAPPPTEARLPASPGSAEFAPQLGAQLSVFVREGVQHARLHLHPAELGPLTVQIELDGARAQVHLAAEHPLTRQALEQAMPTLAGALRDAGLTLTGGGVFEQPRYPQPQDGRAPARGQPRASADASTEGASAPRPVAAARRRGVVDLIA